VQKHFETKMQTQFMQRNRHGHAIALERVGNSRKKPKTKAFLHTFRRGTAIITEPPRTTAQHDPKYLTY